MKCRRCKKIVEKAEICQTCKNELLFYYEATNDWTLALDMEMAQNSVLRYRNGDDDLDENGF